MREPRGLRGKRRALWVLAARVVERPNRAVLWGLVDALQSVGGRVDDLAWRCRQRAYELEEHSDDIPF